MFVKKYYPTKRSNAGLDNFFTDFFNDFDKAVFKPVNSSITKTRPAVNVLETADNFQIELVAPGFTKEDIKIDLEENILKISARKTTEVKEDEEKKYTLREFNFLNFERSFTLPETVDNQGISAKFENGILKLTLGKKEEAKPVPPRTIAIL